jgi:shikimate kinase
VDKTLILIGPMMAGKSTVAELLAARLGLPRCVLDDVRWDYYKEAGYDEDEVRAIHEQEGTLGILKYVKPFEAALVERALPDYPGHVIDFGAGHSVYEDEALFARVEKALAPYPNVFLLLPSPDEEESIKVLNGRFSALLEREVGAVDPALLELNAQFVRRPDNRRLAKQIFYTEGKTAEETVGEMVEGM